MNLLKSVLSVPKAFLAASLILSFVSTSNARSVDRTAVVASLSGNLENIDTAYLLADGRLQLKMQNGVIQKAQVSKAAVARLSRQAQNLADVKVTEVTSLVVCMMMAPQNLSNLQVSGYDVSTDKFDSKLRTVLTDDNCSVSYRVKPNDQHAVAAALELRAELLILALNAVK